MNMLLVLRMMVMLWDLHIYKDHAMSPLEHSLCALNASVNHHEQVVLDMNGGVEAIDMIDLYFSI